MLFIMKDISSLVDANIFFFLTVASVKLKLAVREPNNEMGVESTYPITIANKWSY